MCRYFKLLVMKEYLVLLAGNFFYLGNENIHQRGKGIIEAHQYWA
jgi:hypothetical protein